jgi:hypothetical protein
MYTMAMATKVSTQGTTTGSALSGLKFVAAIVIAIAG